MQLSREEFWVLDVTAQMNCSLYLHLLHSGNADAIFNKRRHHGLSTGDLVGLILFMQRQGDLAVFQAADLPDGPESDELPRGPGIREIVDFSPIWGNPIIYSKRAIVRDFFEAEQFYLRNPDYPLEKERHPGTSLCFCATPQGAAKWEETARVDWNRYVDDYGTTIDDADLDENQSLWKCRAAAVSKRTLDAYFEWKTKWASYLYSLETSAFKRCHTERIHPWRATHWKTFPEGFECDYIEFTVTRSGWNGYEYEIANRLGAGCWPEHHALFDWCNSSVENFPFEGD